MILYPHVAGCLDNVIAHQSKVTRQPARPVMNQWLRQSPTNEATRYQHNSHGLWIGERCKGDKSKSYRTNVIHDPVGTDSIAGGSISIQRTEHVQACSVKVGLPCSFIGRGSGDHSFEPTHNSALDQSSTPAASIGMFGVYNGCASLSILRIEACTKDSCLLDSVTEPTPCSVPAWDGALDLLAQSKSFDSRSTGERCSLHSELLDRAIQAQTHQNVSISLGMCGGVCSPLLRRISMDMMDFMDYPKASVRGSPRLV